MSSDFWFFTKDDDQRWWLIGFLIVFVLFVAMLVSVTLGGAANPEMNALAGVLIALFIGCGAFLGALFVDRAGTAIGVFDEQAEILQNPKELEARRRILEANADLDRQVDYFLRRVYREFAPESSVEPTVTRPAPVARTESASVAVATPPVPPPVPSSGTDPAGPTNSSANSSSQTPKSLAEWNPNKSLSSASGDESEAARRRRQRRDWST
jgi:hypothetical protein